MESARPDPTRHDTTRPAISATRVRALKMADLDLPVFAMFLSFWSGPAWLGSTSPRRPGPIRIFQRSARASVADLLGSKIPPLYLSTCLGPPWPLSIERRNSFGNLQIGSDKTWNNNSRCNANIIATCTSAQHLGTQTLGTQTWVP